MVDARRSAAAKRGWETRRANPHYGKVRGLEFQARTHRDEIARMRGELRAAKRAKDSRRVRHYEGAIAAEMAKLERVLAQIPEAKARAKDDTIIDPYHGRPLPVHLTAVPRNIGEQRRVSKQMRGRA